MKFRHELKYYINYSDYLSISGKLKRIALKDKNARKDGKYKIRSIYFDDYNDKALFEKIAGINRREKFRIRFYNDDINYMRLEKKIKFRGYTKKKSEVIKYTDAENILKGKIDFLKESNKPLFMELYAKMRSNMLRPKTIVDYLREAYIYPSGNVRITFDMGIRSGLFSRELMNFTKPTLEVIPKGYVVFEVKYDEFLPDIISHMIQVDDRSKTAVSKYALARTAN